MSGDMMIFMEVGHEVWSHRMVESITDARARSVESRHSERSTQHISASGLIWDLPNFGAINYYNNETQQSIDINVEGGAGACDASAAVCENFNNTDRNWGLASSETVVLDTYGLLGLTYNN